jgi:iron complex outermembrane receptor protein
MGQSGPCNLTLQGRVLDAGSGLPIPDVMVLLSKEQKGAYTDEQGRFSISGLCSGSHTLIARHLNHEEKRESVLLETALTQKVIYLHCHTDTLHEAVVKGARLHWEDVTVSHQLQGTDLFLSQGGSLGKALERVNGVYSLNTGPGISKPVIRGMHSNRVLILNNELRQEGQQWGNEHAPEIDPYLAQDIEVVKGAQSIRYGSDVIGGIILVNPKSMKKVDRLQADLNLSAFSNGRSGAASLSVEGLLKPLPGLSWRVQGTLRRAGNSRSPDYFLKNTGVRELNYSAALGYRRKTWDAEVFFSSFHTGLGILAASHIGNLTDLYTAFARERPLDSAGFSYTIGFPRQDVLHRLLKGKLTRPLVSLGTMQLLYGYHQNLRIVF